MSDRVKGRESLLHDARGGSCTCAGGIGPDGRAWHDNSRCPLHAPPDVSRNELDEAVATFGRAIRDALLSPGGRLDRALLWLNRRLGG